MRRIWKDRFGSRSRMVMVIWINSETCTAHRRIRVYIWVEFGGWIWCGFRDLRCQRVDAEKRIIIVIVPKFKKTIKDSEVIQNLLIIILHSYKVRKLSTYSCQIYLPLENSRPISDLQLINASISRNLIGRTVISNVKPSVPITQTSMHVSPIPLSFSLFLSLSLST